MSNDNGKVHRFRTGYTRPNISLAEIAERNAAYRKFKENSSRQNYYYTTRESAYADQLKKEEYSKEQMVPRVISTLTKEAYAKFPELIFREYFTTLVKESLIWDDYAIKEMANGIRYMSHKYIAEAIGGLGGLQKAYEETGSTYLKKVYDTCMEAGKAIAKKKKAKMEETINSSNVDNAKLDFSMDSEDEELVDKKMSELNIEDISDLVKDKVLQVVKDENESQKKDDEFVSGLKEDIQAAEAEEKIPENQPRTVNNGDAPAANPTSGTADTEAAGGGGKKKSKNDDEGEESEDDTSTDDTDTEDKEDKKKSSKKSEPKEDESKDKKDDEPKEEPKSESGKKKDDDTDDSSDDKKDDSKSKKDDGSKTDDKKDDDKKAAKESISTYALNSRVEVQRSLFRSMVNRSYSRVVRENAAIAVASEEDPTSAHCISSRNEPPGNVNVYDIYLQGENEDLSYIDFVRNSSPISHGDNDKIDADEILAEAIGMFTLLECAYSIKLISPSIRDLKKAIVWNNKH